MKTINGKIGIDATLPPGIDRNRIKAYCEVSPWPQPISVLAYNDSAKSLGNRHRSQLKNFKNLPMINQIFLGRSKVLGSSFCMTSHPENWRILLTIKLESEDFAEPEPF